MIYFACPCSFAIHFPPRLGGHTPTVTVKGVLVYQVVTEPVQV
jgi:hypothetical protein